MPLIEEFFKLKMHWFKKILIALLVIAVLGTGLIVSGILAVSAHLSGEINWVYYGLTFSFASVFIYILSR